MQRKVGAKEDLTQSVFAGKGWWGRKEEEAVGVCAHSPLALPSAWPGCKGVRQGEQVREKRQRERMSEGKSGEREEYTTGKITWVAVVSSMILRSQFLL